MWTSETETDAKDRRSHIRHEQDLPLALYDHNRELLDEEPQLKNISTHGLGFVTIQQMEPGEEFKFRVSVTGYGILSGSARVSWVSPSSSGMMFLCGAEIRSMAFWDKKRLKKFLEPSSAPGVIGLLDSLLVFAFVGVLYLMAQEMGILSSQTFNIAMDTATNWIPVSVVLLSSFLGFSMYFKH